MMFSSKFSSLIAQHRILPKLGRFIGSTSSVLEPNRDKPKKGKKAAPPEIPAFPLPEKGKFPRDAPHKDQVAVIIGSTDGLGFAIAKRLLRDGGKVMISSRKAENVKKAVEKLQSIEGNKDRIAGFTGHGAKREDLKKLMAEAKNKFGGIDYLVPCVGVDPGYGQRALDVDDDVWDKTMETNFHGPFLAIVESLPYFEQRGGGSILLMSSIAAYHKVHALRPLGVYAVSKTALLALCQIMSKELVSKKIRVNCLIPGIVNTKFMKDTLENSKLRKQLVSEITMGRLGEPREIAAVASFLLSQNASYITGENLCVTGGMFSKL